MLENQAVVTIQFKSVPHEILFIQLFYYYFWMFVCLKITPYLKAENSRPLEVWPKNMVFWDGGDISVLKTGLFKQFEDTLDL